MATTEPTLRQLLRRIYDEPEVDTLLRALDARYAASTVEAPAWATHPDDDDWLRKVTSDTLVFYNSDLDGDPCVRELRRRVSHHVVEAARAMLAELGEK